jgi:hypothetical protein
MFAIKKPITSPAEKAPRMYIHAMSTSLSVVVPVIIRLNILFFSFPWPARPWARASPIWFYDFTARAADSARNVVFAGLVASAYPLLFGLSQHGLSQRPDGNLRGDIYIVVRKNTISQFLKQIHIFLSFHYLSFLPRETGAKRWDYGGSQSCPPDCSPGDW